MLNLPSAAESAVDNLDDVISVKFIQEIIDWCSSHPVISRVSDTSQVYLCGHSRVRQQACCCTSTLTAVTTLTGAVSKT